MANLGSENTPIEGESFGLPSGYAVDEENDDLVIRDTDGTVVMRRGDGAAWQLEGSDISGVGAFDSESVNTEDSVVGGSELQALLRKPGEQDLTERPYGGSAAVGNNVSDVTVERGEVIESLTPDHSEGVLGVAVDPEDGDLWTCAGGETIHNLNRDGSVITTYSLSDADNLHGPSIDPDDGNLWVSAESDSQNDGDASLIKINKEDGNRLETVPHPDAENRPRAPSVDADGDLWISDKDGSGDNVFKIDRDDGSIITSFETGFSPEGVFIDPIDGTLWLNHSRTRRAHNLTRGGELIDVISWDEGDQSTGPSIDPFGQSFWVADWENDVVRHVARSVGYTAEVDGATIVINRSPSPPVTKTVDESIDGTRLLADGFKSIDSALEVADQHDIDTVSVGSGTFDIGDGFDNLFDGCTIEGSGRNSTHLEVTDPTARINSDDVTFRNLRVFGDNEGDLIDTTTAAVRTQFENVAVENENTGFAFQVRGDGDDNFALISGCRFITPTGTEALRIDSGVEGGIVSDAYITEGISEGSTTNVKVDVDSIVFL